MAALALIGMFPQDRWLYLICASLFIGFCTYKLTGKKQPYFWFITVMTFLIIMPVTTPPDSQDFFQTATTRTVATAMGALVYILVAVFLWPQSSAGKFNEASRKLSVTQAQLYRAYRDLMFGEGKPEDSRPLRLQMLQLLAQVEQLLSVAVQDSVEVWEVRHQWRRFHDQSTALMETLGRWRTSLPEIESLDLSTLLPDLDALYGELDLRFAQIERMLGGQAADRVPQAVTLVADEAEMRALTRFQEAAVVVTKVQLDNIEVLSRSLFDCVADIKGYGRQTAEPAAVTTLRDGLAIDLDRLRAATTVVTTLWIGFLLWVYFDPPGDAAFPMMATIFALIIAMVPQISGMQLALSWGGGGAFAGVMFVFVMPHLSRFAELGAVIFVAFFVMHYLFWEPRQAAARMFSMASFLILIDIDNQQTYSFSDFANNVVWLTLALALAVAATYFPASPHPEKVFLRLLRRFFRHAEFLISAQALDRGQKRGIAARWKMVLYGNELLELPGKLAVCGRLVDYRTLPGTAPEQVQVLVSSLYVLALRIKDLADANRLPQAELVEKHLLDDLRGWRQAIEDRFRRRADPTQAMRPVADRLAARLARMEAHIGETFDQAGEGQLSTEDYQNFYRLLGGYRGLSEAAVGYAQLADGIDWEPWREARF